MTQSISISRARGFSLVELAVVLVIIGLIIAAVTSGGYVLRSMRIKSMISAVQDYKGGLLQFGTIYQGLPGDLINASSFFDADISRLPAPSEGSCDYSALPSFNGDGDEEIAPGDESTLANLHLSLAGTTKKTYCGVWGGRYDIGTNTITSDVTQGGAMRITCCGGSGYSRGVDFNNHFEFFTVSPLNDGERSGVLKPLEAHELDLKTDDGVPDTGFVAASGKFDGAGYSRDGCYDGEEDSSAYITNNEIAEADENACIMMFKYD